MLDPKRYDIKSIKKFSKERFYAIYKGKMKDIDQVWTWLHPPKKKGGV